MKKKIYSIDLSAQMAICDANYIRILKLLPGFWPGSKRSLAFPVHGLVEPGITRIEVIEKFTYTSTVRISQSTQDKDYYEPPVMLVRMYHDASTAEVITYQNHKYFKSVYPIPNARMYHADEKQQLNHFLAEWLSLCIEKGLCAGNPVGEHYFVSA
ncbi:MAG: DUF1249 domain-containing protein [Pseudomonadales bacterium]|nr:DUF1249 domain-containing protein [Pseudomonadales bacterium]